MADANLLCDPARRGTVRLVGGPGTGKTTALIAAARAHVAAGRAPESVLLLCSSSQLARDARGALTSAVLRSGAAVVSEPLVRTVHSYAFAVLSRAAERAGAPPPRLVTGTEQDGIVRELLAGDLADGAESVVAWPDWLRPALSTAAFATQLRDLLARCAERGIDPVRLQRVGRLAARPEWAAAGRFAQQYEQVMLLRSAAGMAAPQATTPALGAAELVGAALEVFASDAELLAAEQARIELLLVDDAQHLDPQAARLVRVLAHGAERTVLAGDSDQAVFGFRGADPALLTDHPAEASVTLTDSHRCAPAIAAAINGVAARLSGGAREFVGTADEPGSVSARVAGSAHAEAAVVADALRRAHLHDGLPWSQMAVIVRSVDRMASLPRTLAAAGVPVDLPRASAPPAAQPAVAALLTALEATAHAVTADHATALLAGPIGRVDPVSMRQLRRTLRRAGNGSGAAAFDQQLVAALTGSTPELPVALARAVRRVKGVLTAGARSHAEGQDPRYTLWQVWERSGLQRRWLTAAGRGGSAGAQAERDLDAVTTLFEIAEDYVTRTPGATLRGLVDHVRGLQLAPPARPLPATRDAVTVVSAHEALGREWEFVVIAGVQEGLWPNTVARGGVLNTQQLLDRIDGVAETASTRAPLLAEERRLLIAAMGRARSRLLVTAVDCDSGDQSALPSAFVAELARHAGEGDPTTGTPEVAPRTLAPAAVVGRLRSVVCAPSGAVDERRRARATAQLARLARAGVPGADPATWYGMAAVSTSEPLWDSESGPVTLSPSTLQTLDQCALRWLLERHGGGRSGELQSALGSILHALFAEPHRSEAQLQAELERVWDALPFDAGWHARNELERHRAMLAAFADWRAQTRRELTEVGTEVEVDGVLQRPGPDLPDIRVRGRIDRLERDAAGRLVVVDVKTGKSPVSKDDAQRHRQLAAYQLAVAAGLVGDEAEQPGGGRLVYVAKQRGGAAEREQDALTPQARADWQDLLHRAAAATAGPLFLARVNDGCSHCPVRSSCPAQQTRGGQS